MASIEFIYQQIPTIIQANRYDSFKNITEKFAQKVNVELKTVYFIGNGIIIPENALINDLLKESNSATILVKPYNEGEDRTIFVDSKEIICPECQEPCRFQIENYKIKLSDCKNGHYIQNIKFEEFQSKQNVNYTNIICSDCKVANKGESTDYKFDYCLACNKNLCILCGYKHDKNHKIIDHDNKCYTCLKHNEIFSKYCLDCKKNICFTCEDEHGNHEMESFEKIMPDINKIKNDQKILKDSINLLKQKMKDITDELIGNLEAIYKINEQMIKLFENQKRNYEILKNVNEINFHNKIIIDDINNITQNNKLIDIIQLYHKMKDIQNFEIINTGTEQKKIRYITPLSKDCIIKVYNNMLNYVCGIKREIPTSKNDLWMFIKYRLNESKIDATGFFAKVPYNSKLLHVLITTSKIFWEDEISHKEKIKIYLNNGEFVKTLTLDEGRKIYINKKLDISIIELKKDDGIGFFYELDNSLLRYISDKNKNIFHLCKEYNNESIYSMNYKNIKNVF